jgi:nicotinamidase-related amidase
VTFAILSIGIQDLLVEASIDWEAIENSITRLDEIRSNLGIPSYRVMAEGYEPLLPAFSKDSQDFSKTSTNPFSRGVTDLKTSKRIDLKQRLEADGIDNIVLVGGFVDDTLVRAAKSASKYFTVHTSPDLTFALDEEQKRKYLMQHSDSNVYGSLNHLLFSTML